MILFAEDADIRQIVIPFGAAGYIVRYTVLPESNDVRASQSASRAAFASAPRFPALRSPEAARLLGMRAETAGNA